MTGLQLALLCGAGFGFGLFLVVRAHLVLAPNLGAALRQLRPAPAAGSPATSGGAAQDLTWRIGRWGRRRLPAPLAGTASPADLELLQVDPVRHTGEKVLGAVFGLLAPALIAALFATIGVRLPVGLPLLFGGLFAAFLFLAPDLNAARQAQEARVDFARALAAYMDLVALERTAAAGVTEALESAAAISDCPAFLRLRETLAHARWSGQAPWDGLAELGEQVGVGELVDIASIMRLAGEQSSASAGNLKARAAAIRNTLAEDAHAAANAAGERMILPLSLLAFVYLSILAAPGVLRVLSGG